MWLCSLCRKPQIIKNKYVSTLIGTILIYLSVAFILPVGNFSVYITSYIHLYQDFVTMHFGTYFSPILTLIMTFARSIGGVLEGKIGFMPTTFLGLGILLITVPIGIWASQNRRKAGWPAVQWHSCSVGPRGNIPQGRWVKTKRGICCC